VAYVNVYEKDRRYGGAEEGGWWFNSRDFVTGVECVTRAVAEVVRDALVLDFPPAEGLGCSSVLYRGGDYVVMIEGKPGEDWNDYAPYS